MDTTTLRTPTDWRVVAREQFLFVGRGRLRELVLLGSAWVLIAVAMAAAWVRVPSAGMGTPDPGEFGVFLVGFYFTASPVLLLVVGAFWASSVWKDEGPGRRLFHWSMPVPRPAHDLWRVASGGAWLMVLLAGALISGLIFSAAVGGSEVLSRLPAAFWITWFTGPLILYLLASVAGLLSDSPIRWIIGAPIGWALLMSLLQFGWPAVVNTLNRALVDGTYGLGTAVGSGPVLAEAALSMGGPEDYAWMPVLLWLAVGGIAVGAAARRHATA